MAIEFTTSSNEKITDIAVVAIFIFLLRSVVSTRKIILVFCGIKETEGACVLLLTEILTNLG